VEFRAPRSRPAFCFAVASPHVNVRRLAIATTAQIRAARFRSAFVSFEQAGQVLGIGRATACDAAIRRETLSFVAPTYYGMVVSAVPPE
jgi:hypothetical protein